MSRPESSRRARLRPASSSWRRRGSVSLWIAAVAGLALAATSCSDPDAGPAGSPGITAEGGDADAPSADGAEIVKAVPLADTLSPDAKVSTFEAMERDLAASPHPSDGGGSVTLLSARPLAGPGPLIVAEPARFAIRYTAGPLGVSEGGTVFLLASPFWDWSPPQMQRPDLPGYTEVSTGADGVEIELAGAFESVVAVVIRGRALAPGETIDFVYGAGERGAIVDRYAERGAEISISVDGDGDGYRKLVGDGVRVDVAPGPPAQIVVFGPTVVRPGEPFSVHAHLLDAVGNATRTDVAANLEWSVLQDGGIDPPGWPRKSAIGAAAAGGTSIAVAAPDARTVWRVAVRGDGPLEGLTAVSNPIVVHADAPRVLWGDLHGHSQLSDGTGTPDDYFAYARDVSRLDVAALTDHDHWGLRFLDTHPDLWNEIKASAQRHHAPGQFVTLLGYEWTSWLHGHRHVLYFEDHGPLLSNMDPAYRTPAQLWDGLRGRDALTFAHHSAGGPIATNWAYGADPVLEPVTEIVSVHGSSEAADTPGRIYNPVPGNTVRDVLVAGLRLGFIGSGDSHDGHPGLAQLSVPDGQSGLAAILAEERTREGVLAALRARRSYATNGERIWLHVTLDGQPMGSVLPADREAASDTLRIEVAGTAPIERVDLVRSGALVSLPAGDALEFSHERSVPRLVRGEFHYVRVVQRDGRAAWSSPVFAD